jgi:branched-chain amino acid aminotransferase
MNSTDISDLLITQTTQSRISEVDFNNIPFGRIFSDHMLVMDFIDGEWQTAQIKPFAALPMHPAASALHYGQSFFEGMKAYKQADGQPVLFRPELNARRFNHSAERLCMPTLPEDRFVSLIAELVKLDKHWIPESEDSALYIRPFMYATDEYIGVKASDNYRFVVFTCPVGAYYSEPLRLKIEEYYTRAAEGGVGNAKAAGNYAASLYPAKLGRDKGFHQLLWTDGKTHEYIEESGTMNIVFMIDGVLISPSEESDTILKGTTKRTVFDLAQHWGVPAEERRVTVKEVIAAIREGRLQECFGAGTAATIAQVDVIGYGDEVLQLPNIENREFSAKIKSHIDSVKYGKVTDELNWIYKID